METPDPNLLVHEPKFDEKCPICASSQRQLLERWYVQRRPLSELAAIFAHSEDLISLHARAVKIHKKRSNNTAAIVDLFIERGQQALLEGKMELGPKDLAWAIGHRDRILGRIRDKVDVETRPILVLHTTVPGVGGISNADVKELREGKREEPLLLPSSVAIEVEDVETPPGKKNGN